MLPILVLLSLLVMPIVTGIVAEKRKRDFLVWAVCEVFICAIAFGAGMVGKRTAGDLAWFSGATMVLILPAVLLYLPPPKEGDTLTLDMPLPLQEHAAPAEPAFTEQRGNE